jgi:hypothetical protein
LSQGRQKLAHHTKQDGLVLIKSMRPGTIQFHSNNAAHRASGITNFEDVMRHMVGVVSLDTMLQ